MVFREHELQFRAQTVAREGAIDVEHRGVSRQSPGRAVDPPVKPGGEPGRPHDPRRVLHEGQGMEDPDSPRPKIDEAAGGVD
jgi:hypothetical protein